MRGFSRDESGAALLAGRPIAELLAEAGVPTPAYLYDVGAIRSAVTDLVNAFGAARHLVAYAVKANTAGTIVRAVRESGGGADVVSGGELQVALGVGILPERIVMSGVAKTDDEIDAAIAAGIRAIQVESVEEVTRIAARARAAGKRANVSLRVNPAVRIDSHAHIATGHDEAKFGIVQSEIGLAWQRIDDSAELAGVGVSTHVGSMLETPDPYLESAKVVCAVARARRERDRALDFVDFGGGFAIDYGEGPVRPPADFAKAALALAESQGLGDLAIVVEPGRALVGAFGVLVASVVQEKRSGERRWCMIDAGMNDLVRPALYGAHHRIEPLERPPVASAAWHVVGPVCESADDFGLHDLSDPLPSAVVIRDAGAYGFTMASEYNGRPVPAEVFCESGRVVHVSKSPGVAAWVRSRLEA